MILSKMHKKCKKCPVRDTCPNKRMVAVGFLEPQKPSNQFGPTMLPPGIISNNKSNTATQQVLNSINITVTADTFHEAVKKAINSDYKRVKNDYINR